LKRPLGISVTDKSGVAGIALWINQHLGLGGNDQINKRNPGVLEIAKWVDAQYSEKRTTAISNEEMLTQAKEHLPENFN